MTDSPRQRPGDQQLPVPSARPSIHDLVIEDLVFQHLDDSTVVLMLERRAIGQARYDSLLQAFNSRDWQRDMREEVADALVYAKQGLEEHKEAGTPPGPQMAKLEIAYHTLLFVLNDVCTLSLPTPKPRYGDGEQVQEPPAPGGIS
jgi:hypothetical protein